MNTSMICVSALDSSARLAPQRPNHIAVARIVSQRGSRGFIHHGSGTLCGITKNADVIRIELTESASRKAFGEIFSFAGSMMLLVHAVVMMCQFVEEDVQQRKRARLGISETAKGAFF